MFESPDRRRLPFIHNSFIVQQHALSINKLAFRAKILARIVRDTLHVSRWMCTRDRSYRGSRAVEIEPVLTGF